MNLKWAIYDSRLGRGAKRCGKKHPLWRSGLPESARLRLYALRATTELGEAIASALGSPLAAHEKRQFAPALIACNYMDFADSPDGRIEAAFQVFSQGLFREMTTVVAYHLFALL